MAQKHFFDALDEGLLRVVEEHEEQARYQRLLEQDLKKAQEARRRTEDAEYARLLEEDRRKAEAAHRRAVDEEFAHLLQGDMRKAQEAHRRAMEQEERQRQAERDAMEQRGVMSKNAASRSAASARLRSRPLVTRLRVYEEKWAALRGNTVGVEHIGFFDIPWPSFDNVTDHRGHHRRACFGVRVPSAARAHPGSRRRTGQIPLLGNAALAPRQVRREGAGQGCRR